MASNTLLPTKPFSTSFTLERQFCTFSYRHSPLDSATLWHSVVMPLQVLRSTELLSTPITGYLQGLPLHCRHPASLCDLFDRCSDHFLNKPFPIDSYIHTYIHTYIIIIMVLSNLSVSDVSIYFVWLLALLVYLSCAMNSNTCGDQYLAAD